MKTSSEYPLLERDGELTAIEAAVSRGADGYGGCLSLEGPAGVGKTRLLESVRAAAQERDFRILFARAGEREREYAWGVVRSLFEPVLLAAEETELESLWGGPAAPCRPLLEQGSVPAEGTPDSSFAIFNGFFHAARALASEQPLLLAIDDLHWVDGPSLGFLEFLARRIESHAIVIAGSLRPNEPGSDEALLASLLEQPHGLRLHPQPLSASGSGRALRARLGAVGSAVVHEAHEVTGGNPLLLSELARTLKLTTETEAGSILPGTPTELGSRAIARSVAVRLSRAGTSGRRLAHAAAVLGDDSLVGQAIDLSELESAAADRTTLELVRLEVLKPGSRVQFVHPLVRRAVYESIAPSERVRLHERAVAILERAGAPPERLVNHLLEVDPRGDAKTVAILRAGAVKAAAGGDSRTAAVLMRRALAEPPPEEELTDVLSQLGAAEFLVDGPSAAEHLGAALERISSPIYRQAITELLARALIFQERIPEAVETCERTLAELREAGEDELARRLEAVLIEASVVEPTAIEEAKQQQAMRLLERADQASGDDYGSRALLALSAIAGARGLTLDSGEAVARARRAAAGDVLIREGMNSIAQLGPAQVLSMSGDHAEAIELLNQSLRWDERFGSIFGHLSNLIFRARAQLFSGDLAEAIADATESLRASKAYRIVPGVAWSAATLAEALLESGELKRAGATLDAEIAADQPVPRGWHWMNFIVVRARLRLAAGDAEAALEGAREAGRIYATNLGVGSTWLTWRPTAVEAMLALDDVDGARALAAEELDLTRRWGGPRQIGRALRATAAADESARERSLEEAIAVLEPSEARLELAAALVDLGAARRRANRKADSRELLRRGMDLAHACGAKPLAERARSELRASGVRPRRTALSGPESLTESERRVVELARSGRSNREIAGELFVTVKTVEVHLSSAYRKLGIKGRRDLGAAMTEA